MIDPGRGCEPGTRGLMANKINPQDIFGHYAKFQ